MAHKWVCPQCGFVLETDIVPSQPPTHLHNKGNKHIQMEKHEPRSKRVDKLADGGASSTGSNA